MNAGTSGLKKEDSQKQAKPQHFLAEWAAYLRIDQTELVDRAGIDRGLVWRYFAGQANPRRKNRVTIAKILELDDPDAIDMPPSVYEAQRLKRARPDLTVKELMAIVTDAVEHRDRRAIDRAIGEAAAPAQEQDNVRENVMPDVEPTVSASPGHAHRAPIDPDLFLRISARVATVYTAAKIRMAGDAMTREAIRFYNSVMDFADESDSRAEIDLLVDLVASRLEKELQRRHAGPVSSKRSASGS